MVRPARAVNGAVNGAGAGRHTERARGAIRFREHGQLTLSVGDKG